ncbi:MAG: glucose-1-phosphate cytidylyltransferase [Candidatus Peribacter sp.]|nr:glucose-1-phosphate cytidylyltransferase [Candidatus Peribacter sp.]
MKVVILCGGQGTRLREESEYRPKPLIEVGERPILWHIMKLYAHYGLKDFVLCLGYKGQMIKEYFLNYEATNNDFTIQLGSRPALVYHGNHTEQDFRVTLADTGPDAMTGSRVKKVAHHLTDQTFLLTYGDGVSNVNIDQLITFHRSHGKLATVTTVRPHSRFGVVEMQEDGHIISFAEKPQMDGWASAGYFVCERGVLDYLDVDSNCSFEQEPLHRLAQDGQLMAYRHEGFFYAMDTHREYLFLNEMWKKGNAPWAVWQHPKEKMILPASVEGVSGKRAALSAV